jgi:hypothetical protein
MLWLGQRRDWLSEQVESRAVDSAPERSGSRSTSAQTVSGEEEPHHSSMPTPGQLLPGERVTTARVGPDAAQCLSVACLTPQPPVLGPQGIQF